jgi:hypothetical protein
MPMLPNAETSTVTATIAGKLDGDRRHIRRRCQRKKITTSRADVDALVAEGLLDPLILRMEHMDRTLARTRLLVKD